MSKWLSYSPLCPLSVSWTSSVTHSFKPVEFIQTNTNPHWIELIYGFWPHQLFYFSGLRKTNYVLHYQSVWNSPQLPSERFPGAGCCFCQLSCRLMFSFSPSIMGCLGYEWETCYKPSWGESVMSVARPFQVHKGSCYLFVDSSFQKNAHLKKSLRNLSWCPWTYGCSVLLYACACDGQRHLACHSLCLPSTFFFIEKGSLVGLELAK